MLEISVKDIKNIGIESNRQETNWRRKRNSIFLGKLVTKGEN